MIQLKLDVYRLGWYGQQVGSKGQRNDIPVLQVLVLQDLPIFAVLNIVDDEIFLGMTLMGDQCRQQLLSLSLSGPSSYCSASNATLA